MRKLSIFLGFLLLATVGLAETTKTVFNPFTGKLDFITSLNSDVWPTSGASSGYCLTTDGTHALSWTTCGSGGGSSTLESLFGVARSSPTATLRGSSDFTGSVTGSTMTISMNSNNTAINTFTSSVTVNGAGLGVTYGITAATGTFNSITLGTINDPSGNRVFSYDTFSTRLGYLAGLTSPLETAFGARVFGSVAAGSSNTGIGAFTGTALVAGSNNVLMGVGVVSLSTQTSRTTAVGSGALQNLKTCGPNNTLDGNLTGIGYQAGGRAVIDSSMTFIGSLADRDPSVSTSTVLVNGTAIGAGATVGESNTMQLGDVGPNGVMVKMSSTTVAGSATVGTLKVNNVASGTQCLHADGSGNVTGTGADCGSGGGGGASTLETLIPLLARSSPTATISLSSATFTGSVIGSTFSVIVNGVESDSFRVTRGGHTAGATNSVGVDNAFFGFEAGLNANSDNNSGFGSKAGRSITSGIQGTAVGSSASVGSVGSKNTVVGFNGGSNLTSGNGNSLFGNQIAAVTTGAENVIAGDNSGRGITLGSSNTIVGAGTGSVLFSAADNGVVAIGYGTGTSGGPLTNAIAIGMGATVNASNTMQLGNVGADGVMVKMASATVDGSFSGGSAAVTNLTSGVIQADASHNLLVSKVSLSTAVAGVLPTANVAANLGLGDIGVNLDGGGSVLTIGTTYWAHIPSSGTIASMRITANPSGSATVGVSTSTVFDLTKLGSVCASACPSLSSSSTGTDITLTGWNTAVAKDGWIGFVLNTVATITNLNVTLSYTKS